jgi:hypothetical protein
VSPQPADGALRRGVIAGSVWGIAVAAGLVGLRFWNCGVICIDDAVITTALSMIGGLATMGPLAAFGRPA